MSYVLLIIRYHLKVFERKIFKKMFILENNQPMPGNNCNGCLLIFETSLGVLFPLLLFFPWYLKRLEVAWSRALVPSLVATWASANFGLPRIVHSVGFNPLQVWVHSMFFLCFLFSIICSGDIVGISNSFAAVLNFLYIGIFIGKLPVPPSQILFHFQNFYFSLIKHCVCPCNNSIGLEVGDIFGLSFSWWIDLVNFKLDS